MKSCRILASIRAVAIALAMAASARATLWVSPAGDDRNPGTEEQPFRTIERARDAVRALDRDMADDITVFIAGEYHVDRPIVFGPGDSGTNGFSVIYTGAPGEHPVLSGGLRVTGWTQADKARNLWSAPAPEGLADTRGVFVNGTPAYRTRSRLLAVFSKDDEEARASAPATKAQWKNPDDVVFEQAQPDGIWSERAGPSPAFVENAFEFLGTPGEWYLDRPGHRLYYTPRPGEDMAAADVEAAAAEALIAGTGTRDQPISGLVFKGIRFEYTTCLDVADDEPTVAAPVRPAGAVHLAYATNIQFLEDEFLHMGTPALDMAPGITGCTIEGCLFGDIAWSAVQLVNASDVRIAESRFSYVATGHILEGVIELDHPASVVIEHDQIDHFPTSAILLGSAPAGAVRESSNRISGPMIGFHGGAPAAREISPGAGISQDFQSLGAEPLGGATVPRAPSAVSAEGEDLFAFVTWIPSCQDGGEPVESYTVTSSAGEKVTVSAAAFQEKGYVQVSGLPNGHPVSFTVTATSSLGTSAPSIPTANITPWHKRKLKAPSAPAAFTVMTAKAGASIRITPPVNNGGSPVISYTVTASQGTAPITIEGLDVIRATITHPVERSIAGYAPGAGTTVSAAAVNASGDGKPAVVALK